MLHKKDLLVLVIHGKEKQEYFMIVLLVNYYVIKLIKM